MKNFIYKISIVFFLFFTNVIAQDILHSKSEGMAYKVEKVAENLGVVWAMTFINKDEILFTQRNGKLGVINTKNSDIRWVHHNIPVMQGGQGGLLDVAVNSDYKQGNWIYFTYVKNVQGEGATTLGRAKLNGNELTFWQDLLVTKSRTDTSRHFGSRIAFDNDGHLFFGIGDRGVRKNAQNLSTHAGSILRLNLDGSVPKDNPFVNQKNILPEIWSYGHRNPQGLVYDKQNNRLWEIEHGPRGGDEINLILPKLNYGWPIVSHGKEYWGPVQVGSGTHKDGMQDAHKIYIPSIAPSSLLLYTAETFPKWKGNLFAGALILTHINKLSIDEEANIIKEERLVESLNQRIRTLVQSPKGYIYFSTDSGFIYRIKPVK